MYVRRNVRRNGDRTSVTYSVVESFRDELGQVRQRTVVGLGKCPTVAERIAELRAELGRAQERGGPAGEMGAVLPTLKLRELEAIAPQVRRRGAERTP